MRRKSTIAILSFAFVLLSSLTVPWWGTGSQQEKAREKIGLRVLYVGHPGSEREKDFVGFLEKHFTNVGKAALEKVEVKDAEGFDVVIVDYSGLTVKGLAIIVPRIPFGKEYSRPVLTIGAAGAVACDMLGLKTGYL